MTWAPQCPGFRAAARFFWRTWATWLQTSFSRKALGGIERLAQAAAYTVVVTVDVFADGMRYDEGTEAWRRALARVNAGVAALADRAVEVVCGIPVWMKGEGPTR